MGERDAYEEKVYKVWLAEKKSMTADKIILLLKAFSGLKQIYEAKSYKGLDFLTAGDKKELSDKNIVTAQGIVEKMITLKGEILFYTDRDYPYMLRYIADAPCILYARGLRPIWDKLVNIAVVGTRRYTNYGERAARTICSELAKNGVTIVSGMARGIDSIAGEAALDAGGRTIAVLGCGVDIVYPAENEYLMQRIMHNGTVLSEYPPGTSPDGWRFPKRNRIMSGLSRGVLVVEAPKKSGALITARLAIENNQDVFAVPGDIFMPQQEGTNLLIQQGAKLVTRAEDILEEFAYDRTLSRAMQKRKRAEHLNAAHRKSSKSSAQSSVDEDKPREEPDNDKYQPEDEAEIKIIELLQDGEKNGDELIRLADIPASVIQIKLVTLEMCGVIERVSGNHYILSKGKEQ